MLEQLLALDMNLFLLINNAFTNPFLDMFFKFITYFGSIFFVTLLIIALYAKKEKKSALYLLGGFMLNAVLVLSLKSMISRARPHEAMGARVIAVGNRESFPSGHTTNAFMTASVLSNFYPKFKYPFYILAVLVGISRIYLGVHYPLDVLAGAILGYFIHILAFRLPLKDILKKI
ncbi:MAG: phosphatase PAP2 family protein [Candidatus Aenigmarchaeota archaeon]|nr:phosphatase PAP2 family protein [Candidatus Aenigmarchaeota archaeon]